MPRTARIDLPNFWYHIIVKGVNGIRIFRSENDKNFFMKIMQDLLLLYDIKLSGFCLMDTHIQLLLLRKSIPLYKFMHRLLTRYSLYFNKKYKRKGHLFDERYHSYIIIKERYLINVLCCIHNKPVKAGIVKNAEDFKFSSEAFYIGLKENYLIKKIPNFKEKVGIENYKSLKNMNIKYPIYKTAIGEKADYNLLEKRIKGRDKGKFIERREIKTKENNKKIRTMVISKFNFNEKILQMLKSSKRNRFISSQRKDIVKYLYFEGFSLVDIARFLNKSSTAIFKMVNKLDKNNDE